MPEMQFQRPRQDGDSIFHISTRRCACFHQAFFNKATKGKSVMVSSQIRALETDSFIFLTSLLTNRDKRNQRKAKTSGLKS